MTAERNTWSETRVEYTVNKELTVYEDGHWTAEDKISMTVQRCGSPDQEPRVTE
jgi:hypothetical protein